jgi:hypothetical protein
MAEAARIAAGQSAEAQAKKRGRDPPELLAGAVDLVLKRYEGQAAAAAGDAASLSRYIFDRVKHPRLMRCICDRIAWAVIRGEYPREKLEGVLAQTDKQRGAGRADCWVYFVGVMKRSFAQHGCGELTQKKAGKP